MGWLNLTNEASVDWIGFGPEGLHVEVSSNLMREEWEKFPPEQELAIRRCGFHPPDDHEAYFWRRVESRDAIGAAAFAIVHVLTTAFGVYAA
jgi:hypothetical protein